MAKFEEYDWMERRKIGRAIKAAREQKGLNGAQVDKAVGITLGRCRGAEEGKHSGETLNKIMAYLGINVQEVIGCR